MFLSVQRNAEESDLLVKKLKIPEEIFHEKKKEKKKLLDGGN